MPQAAAVTAVELQHELNEHAQKIVRLEEREKTHGESIKEIRGSLNWLLRGTIVVLLGVVSTLAAVLWKH